MKKEQEGLQLSEEEVDAMIDAARNFNPRVEGDVPSAAEQANMRTGLEFLRDPDTTVEEIAKLLRIGHPPVGPVNCDEITCKDCWMAWLMTGRAPVRGKA